MDLTGQRVGGSVVVGCTPAGFTLTCLCGAPYERVKRTVQQARQQGLRLRCDACKAALRSQSSNAFVTKVMGDRR